MIVILEKGVNLENGKGGSIYNELSLKGPKGAFGMMMTFTPNERGGGTHSLLHEHVSGHPPRRACPEDKKVNDRAVKREERTLSAYVLRLVTTPEKIPSVLYVCVHNAGRSQMAEAFTNALSGGRVKGVTAGMEPGGKVNPQAVVILGELGIDMSSQTA